MEFKQSIVVINFKENITEEERENIIQRIYLDNEKEIIGLHSINMKKNINVAGKVKEVCEGGEPLS